jgi:hypothetical protein
MPENGDRQAARDAAVAALADNLVFLVLLVAMNVAIAKRDVILRGWRRAQAIISHDPAGAREARELAEFRRDISEISHYLKVVAADEPQ